MKTQFTLLAHTIKEKCQIVFATIGAFLLPIRPLLLLVGVMILVDTITGIWKAKKRKEEVTSRKLSKVISKMLLYQLCIITFFLLDKYLLGEFIGLFTSIDLFLTKVSAIILASIELVSINENFTSITGTSLWKQAKLLLARAKELNEDYKAATDGLKPNEDKKEKDQSNDAATESDAAKNGEEDKV